MEHKEPNLKIGSPYAGHDDVSLLYLLDTSSDRALEVDLSSIPRGPEDGPTWAQHDFSDTLSPYEDALAHLLPQKTSEASGAAAAEEVADVLTNILDQPMPPHAKDAATAATATTTSDPAERLSSSTDSELARLYG